MKIDLEKFKGRCVCGQKHTMEIQKVVIEKNALEKLPEVAQGLGLSGTPCIVCDDNTYEAAGKKIASVVGKHFLIRLVANGLHPDENAVEAINRQLPSDTGYVIAAGGGVITDTCKYICHTHGSLPLIIVPTAASVDGFAANTSAMTFNHFKLTLDTQAAAAIVADTSVLAAAPYRLTASGLGDLVGKYITLADWRMANLIAGEDLCPAIFGMVKEALDNAAAAADQIAAQEEEALGKLMYALVLSGLTIQMWGNSRPASGSEHHISHLWELHVLQKDNDGLHGEMVGVGTIQCKKLYEKLFAAVGDHPEKFMKPYIGLPHALLQQHYGPLYDQVVKYNTPDPSAAVDPLELQCHWTQLREIYSDMPTSEEMLALYHRCGMKTTLTDVGMDEALLSLTMRISPYIRGRLTLCRVYNDFFDLDLKI